MRAERSNPEAKGIQVTPGLLQHLRCFAMTLTPGSPTRALRSRGCARMGTLKPTERWFYSEIGLVSTPSNISYIFSRFRKGKGRFGQFLRPDEGGEELLSSPSRGYDSGFHTPRNEHEAQALFLFDELPGNFRENNYPRENHFDALRKPLVGAGIDDGVCTLNSPSSAMIYFICSKGLCKSKQNLQRGFLHLVSITLQL